MTDDVRVSNTWSELLARVIVISSPFQTLIELMVLLLASETEIDLSNSELKSIACAYRYVTLKENQRD